MHLLVLYSCSEQCILYLETTVYHLLFSICLPSNLPYILSDKSTVFTSVFRPLKLCRKNYFLEHEGHHSRNRKLQQDILHILKLSEFFPVSEIAFLLEHFFPPCISTLFYVYNICLMLIYAFDVPSSLLQQLGSILSRFFSKLKDKG